MCAKYNFKEIEEKWQIVKTFFIKNKMFSIVVK